MGDVVANGIKIHYTRTGANKKPLVLLHGITDSGLCWPRLAEALKHDYDLIMPDARAHGLSDAPDTAYTYQDMANDVAGLIEALGLHKAAVLGHSMGAMTAAVLAANHPQRVACLVLEDPPWREALPTPQEQEAMAADWERLILARKTMTLEQMIEESYQRAPTSKRWDKSEFAPWAEAKQRVDPKIIRLLRSGPMRYDDVVPHLACPTLLITADPALGAIVTPELAQKIAGMNAQITVAHIAGAGHNIRREQFDEYLRAVTVFLQKAY